MAVGVLQHGVAALQGRQRGERPGAGALVGDVVAGPVEARGRRRAGPGPSSSSTSSARSSSRLRGSPSAGRLRSASRPACSRASQPCSTRRSRARAVSTRRSSSATSGTTSLAASVGVEARTSATRSSSGWSCSWPIAETTGVRAAVHGADQSLVGERQQVLDRAAAAGHHDDVDVGVAVEPAERLHHLAGRPLALHGGVGDLEGDVGPAPPGVLEDVPLGGGLGRGHQPDPAGQERQRALQLAGEQALGGQQLAALLEPGQQLAEADHPDLADRQRERAAVGVVGGLGEHDHARALDQRRREAVDPVRGAGQRHRDVGDRVAQRHEHRLDARAAG